MLLKIWNDFYKCYSFIDKVRKAEINSYLAFLDNSDKLYFVFKNDNGVLWINTMCVYCTDYDYRDNNLKLLKNSSENKELFNKDAKVDNTIYMTNVLCIQYEDGNYENIIIGNSGQNYILNNEGKTIDRL